MAEETDNPFEEPAAEAQTDQSAGKLKLILRVGLIVAVLAIGSAGGYGLAGLFHGPAQADANEIASADDPIAEIDPPDTEIIGKDFDYIDFDAITVNLDEPRLARYIRATITLAICNKDSAAVRDLLETRNKKKELRNWLTVYLSGRTLEDVRGPKNLNRIRREIQESFNQQLWPGRRPMIDHVLFKEFAVQ